jgi:hypothetical protein
VWKGGLGDDLVLADLCGRCAAESNRLLEIYGGRGRDAMRLTQQFAASAAEPAGARLQMLGAMFVRALVYVLIAFATFLVITFVTARN